MCAPISCRRRDLVQHKLFLKCIEFSLLLTVSESNRFLKFEALNGSGSKQTKTKATTADVSTTERLPAAGVQHNEVAKGLGGAIIS